ncbi:hypothetical protein [Halosegnis longus]|uniref:hypothetical protein n=1 Tax=Halosegnis longus TaxID=2216012 RepID=UPI00129EE5C5|nr:hypothetical protein [Halosegnis longus]
MTDYARSLDEELFTIYNLTSKARRRLKANASHDDNRENRRSSRAALSDLDYARDALVELREEVGDADETAELAILADELAQVKTALDEDSTFETPDCHYCGREMSFGAVDSKQVTYGCYRDDCDIHEKDEFTTAYTVKRDKTEVQQLRSRYDTIRTLIHRIARERRYGGDDT